MRYPDRVTLTRQLALPFPQTEAFSETNFLPGDSNAEALAWLANPDLWPGARLALHGPSGAGKTHLLHVFAEQQSALLLPGTALRHFPDLPWDQALAIDDADAAPEPEALLHVLNTTAERGLPVLLAAISPPAHWPVTLPDLSSRLRAITAIGLGQPDDALLRALLSRLIADRQLRVDAAVQDYLLARLPRTGAALREAAARLDHASLAAGRRVTRAIAASVLAGMACSGTDAFDEDLMPSASDPSQASPGLL